MTPHRPSPPKLATPTATSLTNPAVWSRQQDLRPAEATGRTTGTSTIASGGVGGVGGGGARVKKRKPWRKLLWVKQDYPENWVDPTFLSQLQRNINVHPYDFYSLVADSTVIVQHLSSVVIFVTSFIAMVKEQVSPVSVALVSTALTVAGWAVWDVGWERRERAAVSERIRNRRRHHRGRDRGSNGLGLGLDVEAERRTQTRTRTADEAAGAGGYFPLYPPATGGGSSGSGSASASTPTSPVKRLRQRQDDREGEGEGGGEGEGERTQGNEQDEEFVKKEQRSRRLKTAKSTLLIYFTLLGLSPILRSLTSSITDDSIWAITTWLFLANTLSFDYGSGVDVKFPASLSTNAAITCSVVLASRLPSEKDLPPDTAHVFSLVLVGVQVFGLFPVFRRYLKFVNWGLHVALTVGLVAGAAAGLGAVVGWGWAVVWVLGVVGGMGGCGWWLISLQKYKNEIHGPWDPARPVIRRQWE